MIVFLNKSTYFKILIGVCFTVNLYQKFSINESGNIYESLKFFTIKTKYKYFCNRNRSGVKHFTVALNFFFRAEEFNIVFKHIKSFQELRSRCILLLFHIGHSIASV